MKKKIPYVDNKRFHQEILNYKQKIEESKDAEKPLPRMPEYIGECIYKIANKLAMKPCFSGYSFKEEMISDGIENCIQYIHNFNPERSQNPFAYFTQIIHYAFLRRIQKEKKQMEIRAKIIERSGYDEVFTVDGDGFDSAEYNSIKDNVYSKLRG